MKKSKCKENKSITVIIIILSLIPIVLIGLISLLKRKNLINYDISQLIEITAALLSYIGTCILGILAYYQNLIQKKENEKSQNQLKEINDNQLKKFEHYKRVEMQKLLPILEFYKSERIYYETDVSKWYIRSINSSNLIKIEQMKSGDFREAILYIHNEKSEKREFSQVKHSYVMINSSDAVISEVNLIKVIFYSPVGIDGNTLYQKGITVSCDECICDKLLKRDMIKNFSVVMFLDDKKYEKFYDDQFELCLLLKIKLITGLNYYEYAILNSESAEIAIADSLDEISFSEKYNPTSEITLK